MTTHNQNRQVEPKDIEKLKESFNEFLEKGNLKGIIVLGTTDMGDHSGLLHVMIGRRLDLVHLVKRSYQENDSFLDVAVDGLAQAKADEIAKDLKLAIDGKRNGRYAN
jgi:hypothetical protein